MNTISIPGNPISKKRPRFARMGKGVATYNNQKTEEGLFLFEVMQKVRTRTPSTEAIKIHLLFFMKRPKSHYGTGKNAGKIKNSAPEYHTSKPDIDNMVKFVFDCLNKYLWKDDSQIIEITSKKMYGSYPRTEITWEYLKTIGD